MLAAWLAATSALAEGQPVVTNVEASQRQPWNGAVDITYEVEGDLTAGLPEWDFPVLVLSLADPVSGTNCVADVAALSGDMGLEEGSHHVVWNLDVQGVELRSDQVVFSVAYVKPFDVPGIYCVVDLSAGAAASSYPVSYVSDVPQGGWTDECKTTNLVLRLIGPGAFKMGGQCDVTLSKPYYCGVFEVTQRQYELVVGSSPSAYKGEMRPVENVSWNKIRGTSSTYDWPESANVDGNSFVGRMQARTGLRFDLPTEAQWEFACRAGTTSEYNNGGDDEADLDLLGRYDGNQSDDAGGCSSEHTTAGSYEPNAWGIYDMHGNVWEWCLDWYGVLSGGVTDPPGPTSGTSRVVRGGSWSSEAGGCTSSKRSYSGPSSGRGNTGFRLAWSLDDAEESVVVCSGAGAATSVAAGKRVPFAAVDVEVTGYSGKYDGEGHGVCVTVAEGIEDATVMYATSADGVFAAEPPAITNAGSMTVWCEISAPGYLPQTNSAAVAISERTVFFMSKDASKAYDGEALTCHEIEVSGDGFVDGEGVDFVFCGLQTEVGTSQNLYEFTMNGGTLESNYVIDCSMGFLVVTKADNEWLEEPSVADWTAGREPAVPNMGEARFGEASVSYGESGCPSEPGDYVATFVVPGTDNYAELTKDVPFRILPAAAPTYLLTLAPNNAEYGEVSGDGAYEFGAEATISATAKAGNVFAGWFADVACTKPLNPEGYDNRSPTVKIAMPGEDTAIYAKFVTVAADKKALKFSSATKKLAKTPAKATAGKAFSLKLGISSASLATVTAKGLPKGLSIDKATGEISGKASVTGDFTATVTVKDAAGNKITQDVKMTVNAPSWAKGAFYGTAKPGKKNSDPVAYLQFSVGATGKVSGKVTYKGKAYSFTSAYKSCTSSKATFAPKVKVGSSTFKPGTVTVKAQKIDGLSLVEASAAKAGVFAAQKKPNLVKKGKPLAALVGKTFSFTKKSANSGLTKSKDKLSVKLVSGDAVKVAGTVKGKKLTALSWVALVSGKETSGGSTVYTLYVDIIDASLKYERTLVITATVGKRGTKASAAFAK
ncbi:MAG: SUMF1/EgtB/PvdO family nonheme iron enzyme [Kiritimatiellae bacterium]|nr:SUMF1/EgtB/PvdO family nonheme iron enzyme [Kiritimatiellia bacterium]